MKTLSPLVNGWSYIVNENGNALRMSIVGYGSCTPASVLQKMIDNMSPENFEKTWQECEKRKDIKD